MDIPEPVKQNVGGRECGMMTTAAIQGGGKTYQNMHIIAKYVVDKIDTKVRGRKSLIFDSNGEYTKEEFEKNGIPNFNPKRIALKHIRQWCRDPKITECRRIDAKSLSISEKKAALEYVIGEVNDCQLVLEDINTYIMKLSNMEEIVGRIVKLRHIGVDVVMSFQSTRAIEPRIWQNSRWVRLHFISDNIDEIKDKIPNYQLFKIAQIMINKRFEDGDKRFFVYITGFGRKIEGPTFRLLEWEEACKRYLLLKKKEVKEHAMLNECSEDESRVRLVKQYTDMYYDNPDLPKKSVATDNINQPKQIPDLQKKPLATDNNNQPKQI